MGCRNEADRFRGGEGCIEDPAGGKCGIENEDSTIGETAAYTKRATNTNGT